MSNASNGLTAQDITWVRAYADEVVKTFSQEFEAAKDRFKDGDVLLDRFNAAVEAVLKNGRGYFRAVDEAHNELCIASVILGNTKLKFISLEYEPTLPGCAKTIDFRATAENGEIVYVDVKTIKPQDTDRWQQFEKAKAEGWIPGNIIVAISENGLGGEIWHWWFTARSRMLEYSLELEQKIAEAELAKANAGTVLFLCGEGFRWHQDLYEDFVASYLSGLYREDDVFSLAERKYMDDNKISLKRTISRFAYLQRKQGEIRPNRLNWNVRPPRDSFF